MLFVYILRCSDNSYYTGVTSNVEQRLNQHEAGVNQGCYTFKRRPLSLVFSYAFTNYHEAIAFEKRVKKWSRKKKECLINDDWEGLVKIVREENERKGVVFRKPTSSSPLDTSRGDTY